MEERQELIFPFYARLALVLLAILLISMFMVEGRQIIIPLFFSVLFAFVLLPLTKWLEHLISKWLAAFISILLFLVFIAGVIYFLGVQVVEFSRDLPLLGQKIQDWVFHLQNMIARHFQVDASAQLDYFQKSTDRIITEASIIAQNLVLAISGFAIWTIFVFIFTYFILTHRGLLKRFLVALFTESNQPRVYEIVSETRYLAKNYILGLLVEMLVVGVLNVSLLLLFGIRYAMLLGVLAAVLNIIPYLGIYTATALAAIITLSNSSSANAIIVIITLLAVHFVDANLLLPNIVGRRVKMNPLITIVAVLVGNIMWGIPGMFLFIPLVGFMKIIFERVDSLKPWALLMGTEKEISQLTTNKSE